MDESSDSDSGEGYIEVESTHMCTTCLFCPEIFKEVLSAVNHLNTTHNFDLPKFQAKHALDMHSYIKLINFIRKTKITSESLDKLCITDWDKDEYLIPVIKDDSWLMIGKKLYFYNLHFI